jgi:beta-lactamase superfamily II metal-dependent hydrolase
VPAFSSSLFIVCVLKDSSMKTMCCRLWRLALLTALLFPLSPGRESAQGFAGEKDGRLDIYFIDVEGGASTLLVSPHASILIDSGYPDNMGRDHDRILKVVRDVAKLDHIDHAFVSHWHMDHYGNHASVAAEVPIRKFWDRGIPDGLSDDKLFGERIALYRAASQNSSTPVKAGDHIVFDAQNSPPLQATVLTASRQVIANTGKPNPFAAEHQPRKVDTSDNAASVSMLYEFGPFRFLTCGDLTWNVEAELVTPNNPIGQVDVFMVTHHGLPVSNNPVLVKAVDPVVAMMCNGPSKGGSTEVISTVRSNKSHQALYQLHRNLSARPEEQAPAEYIANEEDTTGCKGNWVKLSVAPNGTSYTMQIGPDGAPRTFQTRGR